jgi:ABC-type uncharacterized transport system permease subunit
MKLKSQIIGAATQFSIGTILVVTIFYYDLYELGPLTLLGMLLMLGAMMWFLIPAAMDGMGQSGNTEQTENKEP